MRNCIHKQILNMSRSLRSKVPIRCFLYLPQHSLPIPPQPLPSNKVGIVLINYSPPCMIRDVLLMENLLAHPNDGKVLLLHSNLNT